MVDKALIEAALVEIEEMLDQADGMVGDALPSGLMTALPGWEYEVRFIMGWGRHIDHLLYVVRGLLHSDYTHAAAPLVRLMLEDAVNAALVARDPASWEAVLAKARSSENRIIRDMNRAGVTPPEELEDFVSSLPPSVPEGYGDLMNMGPRFRALGEDGDRLLVTWGLLTQMSHGNVHTASLFLDWDGGPGGIPSVRLDPQVPANRFMLYMASLDSVLLAAESLSQVLVDDPLRGAVLDIHQRKAQVEDRLLNADD
ncbi:hypothetical protein [Jiangella mangrovi]|uniref:Uncharacterized protein n=1 Tax=Jiangella mangrovi TaxID=1524084 RepID=A0A7W9GXB4_9ACTN|nr:hypothetical protein [Jiangella mangrovi]MBB5791792.1 hypothetical protein [Jiangella mangrovi]